MLNKKGEVHRRYNHCWEGFTHDQVEIVAEDHKEWLTKRRICSSNSTSWSIRMEAKIQDRTEAIAMLIRRLGEHNVRAVPEQYTGRRANPGDGPGIHREGSPYEHAD
jgi:hypothetical protein